MNRIGHLDPRAETILRAEGGGNASTLLRSFRRFLGWCKRLGLNSRIELTTEVAQRYVNELSFSSERKHTELGYLTLAGEIVSKVLPVYSCVTNLRAPQSGRLALESQLPLERLEAVRTCFQTDYLTGKIYRREVDRFIHWCQARKLNVLQVSSNETRHYFAQDHRTRSSKKQALAALRTYFQALLEIRVIPANPFRDIQLPASLQRAEMKLMTDNEVHTLLDSIQDREIIDLRDKALLAVLSFVDMKSSDVLRLTYDDYRPAEGILRFRTAPNKPVKIVPVREAAAALNRYLDLRTHARTNPLFCAAFPQSLVLTERALSAHAARQMLKRRLKAAGMSPSFSLSSLRPFGDRSA